MTYYKLLLLGLINKFNAYICLLPVFIQHKLNSINNLEKSINLLINNYFKLNKAYFVKIGAHDGVSLDPVYSYIVKYKWSGICVEPVKYLFEKLKYNYRQLKDVDVLNLAISNTNEKFKDFYVVDINNSDIPDPGHFTFISSFSKLHIIKCCKNITNIEKKIKKIKVPCITFLELLEKKNVDNIDLIHLDVEGYDYEILKTIDLDNVRPYIIIFEHSHLDSIDIQNCRKYLTSKGYNVIQFNSGDTIAYLNKN